MVYFCVWFVDFNKGVKKIYRENIIFFIYNIRKDEYLLVKECIYFSLILKGNKDFLEEN